MAAASSLVTAQTAGKKLETAGLVYSKTLPADNLSRVYVLTTKGAAYLNQHYMEQWLESDGTTLWFADGYNLSVTKQVARRPLIALLHQMAAATGWHPVGQRVVARGFLSLSHLKHFEALLLNADGEVQLAVFLAHSAVKPAGEMVQKLAKAGAAFAIAADTPSKLAACIKWRASANPRVDAYVKERLPAGVVA